MIIRDVRFRRGAVDDSLQFNTVSNVIADHVSAEWSSDNDVSVLNSTNVTVQWSIMADSLYLTNNPQGFGSLLRYGSGALSFHHNLYADNYNGSPRLGDNISLDFVNNVIYNWGTNSGFSSTNDDIVVNTNGFTNELNYVCNYLIAGTDTTRSASHFAITNIAFVGGTTDTWIYQTNNFIDSNTNGILDGANTQWGMFTNQYTKFGRAFPLVPVPTDEAFLAYERVLDFAGPDMALRDAVDTNIVSKVRTQTGTLISTPPLAGLVSWWRAESNALDSVGTNNGFPTGGITYTNGEVGQAFVLNGSTSYVPVPASPSLDIGANGSGITIEGWVKPNSQINSGDPIVEWDSSSSAGLQLWVEVNFQLFANIVDTANNNHLIQSANNSIGTNSFQHVAVTYDKSSGLAVLYTNGVQAFSQNIGSFTPQTSYATMNIGRRTGEPIGDGDNFNGLLDEISIYKRALSSNEIAAIYQAGSAGKFSTPSAPVVSGHGSGRHPGFLGRHFYHQFGVHAQQQQ